MKALLLCACALLPVSGAAAAEGDDGCQGLVSAAQSLRSQAGGLKGATAAPDVGGSLGGLISALRACKNPGAAALIANAEALQGKIRGIQSKSKKKPEGLPAAGLRHQTREPDPNIKELQALSGDLDGLANKAAGLVPKKGGDQPGDTGGVTTVAKNRAGEPVGHAVGDGGATPLTERATDRTGTLVAKLTGADPFAGRNAVADPTLAGATAARLAALADKPPRNDPNEVLSAKPKDRRYSTDPRVVAENKKDQALLRQMIDPETGKPYYSGTLDGRHGPKMDAAVAAWKRDHNKKAPGAFDETGDITAATRATLRNRAMLDGLKFPEDERTGPRERAALVPKDPHHPFAEFERMPKAERPARFREVAEPIARKLADKLVPADAKDRDRKRDALMRGFVSQWAHESGNCMNSNCWKCNNLGGLGRGKYCYSNPDQFALNGGDPNGRIDKSAPPGVYGWMTNMPSTKKAIDAIVQRGGGVDAYIASISASGYCSPRDAACKGYGEYLRSMCAKYYGAEACR